MIERALAVNKKLGAVIFLGCLMLLGVCSTASAQISGMVDNSPLGSVFPGGSRSKSAGSFKSTLPLPKAQEFGGCDNSPENPTIVLAVLSAAVFGFVAARREKKISENECSIPRQ